jgi:hypothetical protein
LNNKEAELFEEAQEFSSFCEKGGMQPVLPKAEQNAQAIEDQSTDW